MYSNECGVIDPRARKDQLVVAVKRSLGLFGVVAEEHDGRWWSQGRDETGVDLR
ncbi:MAG TPA: hypothetical protein PK156_00490 [Polyangium sp.]|nr:hypothetical protein [Polyangium sp.]